MVMGTALTRSGETEIVVIVKAAPQVGQRHGETVCCAGIDLYGNWLRLYPVAFRTLDDGQKFGRWDRVRFKWRLPTDDGRAESRRVDQDSIVIDGGLKRSERETFLARSIVTGINKEMEAGRSLALLKPRVIDFRAEKKKQVELDAETKAFAALHAQTDLFNTKSIIPTSRVLTVSNIAMKRTTASVTALARIGRWKPRFSTGESATAKNRL